MTAIAVTSFDHAVDTGVFDSWLRTVLSEAESTRGFVAVATSTTDGAPFDWAVAVTFESEDLLHHWLDGATWKRLVRSAAAQGFPRVSSDLVIAEGAVVPAGVAILASDLSSGMETDFQAAHTRLTAAAAGFPGYEGTAIFEPDRVGKWLSLIRFRTEGQLSDWLASPQRQEVLPPVRSTLTRDFSVLAQTTPFGTTVRAVDGKLEMTPRWKSAMLLLMVIYPMAMLLSRFVAPVIAGLGAAPWLSMWLVQIISVVLMQWWLMPTASSWCRRWLDPVDGAGWRIGLRGALIAASVYAVSLTVFATVEGLQHWH